MVIVAIVQARTGSTRLPGKVLINLDGKTVLEHVIFRLKKSKKLNKIIVATTNKKDDDKIEQLCHELGIDVFRGEENNVLKRYLDASRKLGLSDNDTIVRITADCPLVDPKILDKMLELHKNTDYTFNNVFKSMLPGGLDVEIFPLKILKKASEDVEKLPENVRKFYQEHVSKYIADNNDKFRHNLFVPPKKLRRPDIKLSIDTKEDLERVRWVLEKLKEKDITAESIVKLFSKPEIAIYTTATPEIGTGHLKRMVTLANILQKKIDCSVTFYINDREENKKMLDGFIFKTIDPTTTNILKFVKDNKSAAVHIIDILGVTEPFGKNVITIDTPFNKEDIVIISPKFTRRKSINKKAKIILISMGGSDPDEATKKIIGALKSYDMNNKKIYVVIGPMFKNREKIKELAEETKNIEILENTHKMSELMKRADIGIGSAGATIREMISTGLPCIAVAVSDQQEANITALGKKGFCLNLGRAKNLDGKNILNAIKTLENYKERKILFEKQKFYRPDNEKILNEIITALIPH